MERRSVSILMLHKQAEGRRCNQSEKLLLRVCSHSHGAQVDPFGPFLVHILKMNICTSAVKMPKAWAVEIESITKKKKKEKTRLVTVLSRGLVYHPECVEIVIEEIEIPTKKSSQVKLSGFKEVTVL